jgi:hypothetical protein
MICYECGGNYQKNTGLLNIEDQFIGIISVNNVTYYKCENCGDLLYPEETAKAIEVERNHRIEEILKRYPIKDYLNAAETASLLGVSRQALNKNRRIRHGFIYQIKFGGSTVYLKQSVLQYQATGDGRFKLYSEQQHVQSRTYEKVISDKLGLENLRYPKYTIQFNVPDKQVFMGSYISQKEKCYAKN